MIDDTFSSFWPVVAEPDFCLPSSSWPYPIRSPPHQTKEVKEGKRRRRRENLPLLPQYIGFFPKTESNRKGFRLQVIVISAPCPKRWLCRTGSTRRFHHLLLWPPCPIRLILLALVSSGTAVRKGCFCNHDSSNPHLTEREMRRDSPPDHQQCFVIIQPAMATIFGKQDFGLWAISQQPRLTEEILVCLREREALAAKAFPLPWMKMQDLAPCLHFPVPLRPRQWTATRSTATVNCREYYWKCN